MEWVWYAFSSITNIPETSDNKLQVVLTYSLAPPTCSNPISVPANHIDIAKFDDRDDHIYKALLAELKRMIKLAKERGGEGEQPDLSKGSVTHKGNNDRGALANYRSQVIGGGKGEVRYGNTNNFGS